MIRTAVAAVGCWVIACSGGETNDVARFPTACESEACTTGAPVADASVLVARINATTEWPVLGLHTSGCMPASEAIPISGAIVLDSAALELPPTCGFGCFQGIRFALRSAPPGVQCLGEIEPGQLCTRIGIQDTHVRLRMVKHDLPPFGLGGLVPTVEVLPGCGAECSTAELACDATDTCWADAREHCAYCLGGTNAVCVCRDDDDGGAADDGKPCELYLSGDVVELGTCRSGTCIPSS